LSIEPAKAKQVFRETPTVGDSNPAFLGVNGKPAFAVEAWIISRVRDELITAG